jgi:hypothetical protein
LIEGKAQATVAILVARVIVIILGLEISRNSGCKVEGSRSTSVGRLTAAAPCDPANLAIEFDRSLEEKTILLAIASPP